MPFFKEGSNPQPRTPNADCYAYTFGTDLASGKTTPCTAAGQRAEYVYESTVAASPDEDKFAVGVLSPVHSGGTGVPVLAGGPVDVGHEVCVGMVNFENNDGDTVSLPVAIDIDDAEDGAYVVGRCVMGSSATAADTDVNRPSLALLMYDYNTQQPKGGVQARGQWTFHIDLADQAASGNVIDGFAPGFAGVIIDHQFVVDDPATTAAKAIDLNLEIGSTNVTGGVVAITSATATPRGKVLAGTAITANNTFDADDLVSVEVVVTAAFVEGSGTIVITYEQTPAA